LPHDLAVVVDGVGSAAVGWATERAQIGHYPIRVEESMMAYEVAHGGLPHHLAAVVDAIGSGG